MNYQFMDLIYIRAKSFATEVLIALAILIGGFLTSPQFAEIVSNNFQEVWIANLILIGTSGLVKHLMNLKAIKDYQSRVGSYGDSEPPILI